MVSRLARVTQGLQEGSMGGRRVRRPVSDPAETAILLAANAANSVPHSKIVRLGPFAALFVFVAVPIDMPSVAANSTLKCYDSLGNYEPCVTQAGAAPSRSNGRTAGAHQPASWTAAAPYQQASWATTAVQPANWTTSAPPARRISTPLKRPALARCRRRLIPCLFSTLRRGLTHIASAVAVGGQARPAREHL